MSTKLGTLIIQLTASTDQFAKGMADAKRLSFDTSRDIVDSLRKIGDEFSKMRFDSSGAFKRSAETAGGILAGIGIAAVGASIVVTKEFAAQAKEISKLSQSYGLTVEQVSSLRAASELTGVPLEELTTGLGRLARNAAATAEGSKHQTEAFRNLGVTVTDSAGHLRPMNDLIADVAGRFSKLQDSTGKTALAMQLFGRSGAALIPFLNEGKEGIEQLQRVASELGITLSADDVEAGAKLEETMKLLDIKAMGFKEHLAIGLTPAINDLTSALLKLDGTGNSFAQSFGENLGTTMKEISEYFESSATEAEKLKIVLTSPLADFWSGKVKQELADLDQSYREFSQRLHGAGGSWGDTGGGDKGNPTFPSVAPAKSLSEMFDLLTKANAIFDKDNSLQKQIDAIRALQLSIDQFRNAHPESIFLNLNDAANKLDAALKNLLSDQAEWSRVAGVVPGLTQNALRDQIGGALSLPQVAPPASGLVQQQRELYDLGNDMNEQNRERLQIFEQTRTPMEKYLQDLDRLNVLYADKSSEEYTRAVADLDDKLREQYDPTIRLKKALDDIALAYSLGALNAEGMSRAVAKVNADIALANTVSHPQSGIAGAKQGIGAGAQSVGAEWGGIPAETAQATIQAAHSMQGAFSNFFTSVALGTKSLGQAFAQLGRDMLTSIVQACAQMLAQWITTHVIMAAVARVFGGGGDPAANQSAKTAAANTSMAESYAGLAAAEAFAFYMPEGLWTALAMAGIADGIGQGFVAQAGAAVGGTSAAGGMFVDSDQSVNLHKGEMVLPATLSKGFRGIIDSFKMPQAGNGHLAFAGSGGGSSSNTFGGHTFNTHIHGVSDPQKAADIAVERVKRIFKTGGVMK